MNNIIFSAIMAALLLDFAQAAVDTRTSAGDLSKVSLTDLCNYTKNHTYSDLFDRLTNLTRVASPKLDWQSFDTIVSKIRNGTLNVLGGEQYLFFSKVCMMIKQVRNVQLLRTLQILQPTYGNYYPDALLNTDISMAVELFQGVARQAKERGYGNIK
ncbi:MAG: hypothetical protein CNLJKLNK_00575 [Holosporales bacterium]